MIADRKMQILMATLRARAEEKLEERRQKFLLPFTPPKYDEVYFQGLDWLDTLE